MPTLIAADLHLSSDRPLLLQRQNKFFSDFKEILFQNRIDRVLFLGDTIHEKRLIYSRAVKFLTDLIESAPHIEFVFILGNHDYLSDPEMTPLRAFRAYQNVDLVLEPKTVLIEKKPSILIPFLRDSEPIEKSVRKALEEGVEWLFGHFDVRGFLYSRTRVSDDGFDISSFSFFKRVYLGHYHLPQKKKNVVYVGSPYMINFSEANVIDLSNRVRERLQKRLFILDGEDETEIGLENCESWLIFFDEETEAEALSLKRELEKKGDVVRLRKRAAAEELPNPEVSRRPKTEREVLETLLKSVATKAAETNLSEAFLLKKGLELLEEEEKQSEKP